MNHELHAARFVEEPLDDDRLLRRHRAESRGVRRDNRQADGRGRAMPTSSIASAGRFPDGRIGAARDLAAQTRDLTESSSVRPGASPSQNGILGGGPGRPRPAPSRARPAGCGSTCCRAGKCRPPCSRRRNLRSLCRRTVLGLEHHLIVGGVGDRAAGSQRGRPRAAPAAQNAIDRVVMDQAPRRPRRVVKPSASMRTRVEILRGKGPVRPAAAQRA